MLLTVYIVIIYFTDTMHSQYTPLTIHCISGTTWWYPMSMPYLQLVIVIKSLSCIYYIHYKYDECVCYVCLFCYVKHKSLQYFKTAHISFSIAYIVLTVKQSCLIFKIYKSICSDSSFGKVPSPKRANAKVDGSSPG